LSFSFFLERLFKQRSWLEVAINITDPIVGESVVTIPHWTLKLTISMGFVIEVPVLADKQSFINWFSPDITDWSRPIADIPTTLD